MHSLENTAIAFTNITNKQFLDINCKKKDYDFQFLDIQKLIGEQALSFYQLLCVENVDKALFI